MEGGSVLVGALLHQRYDGSFHLVSCKSEKVEGGMGTEKDKEVTSSHKSSF